MFLMQGSTRNHMNLLSKEGGFFKRNFETLHAGMRLAHFDTVNNVIKVIKSEELVAILAKMINTLIRAKVIKPKDGYYHIVMDAT